MNSYLTFEEFFKLTYDLEPAPLVTLNSLFGDLLALFNGTKNNPYYTPENPSDPQTLALPTYLEDMDALTDFIFSNYNERAMYPKWKQGQKVLTWVADGGGNQHPDFIVANKTLAYEKIKEELIRKMNTWVSMNSDRIIRSLGVLQLSYNPVENYLMHENFDDTPTGEMTRTHSLDKDEPRVIKEVNAPLTEITLNNEMDVTGLNAAAKVSIESSGNSATSSDSRRCKIHGNATAGENGASATDADGTDMETENQVTTFDSDTYHNNDKTKQKGDTSSSGVSANYNKTDGYGNYKYTVDTGDYGYTDTESYDEYNKNHQGWRRGNIGVTTTQQMIESEIALRSRPIAENLLREGLNQIFLQLLA